MILVSTLTIKTSKPTALSKLGPTLSYLTPFKPQLEKRVAYGKSQLQRGLAWYEYSMLFAGRLRKLPVISFPDIVSHGHLLRDGPSANV